MAIKEDFLKVVKDRRFQIAATIVILLVILIWSSWMRTQNLSLLKDATTGEYIPAALDPFYFLRLAQTIVQEGALPTCDNFRVLGTQCIGWSPEILPQVIVYLYKIANVFGSYSLQYIDVISPVIFYAIGLILFFFLCLALTKSKITSLISSLFLAFIPAYLYRTTAGFVDHEAIGMVGFFAVMLAFVLIMKYLENKEKIKMVYPILMGLGLGILSAFTVVAWGGVAIFVFLIIPFAFFVFWLLKSKGGWNEKLSTYLAFYVSWIFLTNLVAPIFGLPLTSILRGYMLSSNGILSLAVLGIIIVDYIFINFIKKDKIKSKAIIKYRIVLSFLAILIFGGIFLTLMGNSLLNIFKSILAGILGSVGAGRVGSTVAENASPFLDTWIGQTGKIFFWVFLGALILLGFDFMKGIGKKLNKVLFVFVWLILIFGLIFSKYSASAPILNGASFISNVLYIGSLLLFFGYLIWMYFNEKIELKSNYIIIFAWTILMFVIARATIRVFFAVIPLFCFVVGFGTVRLFEHAKKSKDDVLKLILWVLVFITIIALMFSIYNLSTISSIQVKYTGPSAGLQWQKAMSWVRDNTPSNAIFAHWWDYGYWVEYLGERATISDGGHFEGNFRDHLIGRYVLTGKKPNLALSFMKSNNISYLLIDQSDLGKYPAYSKIGSDASDTDRLSQIPVLVSNPSQTQETNNGTIRVYQGAAPVDEDIAYENEGEIIFLPANKAFIIGLVLEMADNGKIIKNPYAIFVYNQRQYQIPIRYIYYNKQIIDFKQGIDVVMDIIPLLSANSQGGLQVDNVGAAIYLSPNTKNSLFAQLYLLNDVFDKYPTITLAHAETHPSIDYLNMQGANLPEIVYYGGVLGPIKIWEVDYPSNIKAKEEFLRISGSYAEFDNLTVTA